MADNNPDNKLRNLHNALQLNEELQPELRVGARITNTDPIPVSVDTVTITGDINVDKVRVWDGTNLLLLDQPNTDTVPTTVWGVPAETFNMVYNGVSWDRMRGNATDGVTVSLSDNTVDIGTNGTVTLAEGTATIGKVDQADTSNPWVVQGDFTNSELEFTSKNRLKVSPYETLFFNTFQYSKETDVWDEAVIGTGAATHNVLTNSVDMYVDGGAGSKITRQTKNAMRYIPGRTSTLTYAVRLEYPQTGIRRRFGLFNEFDGVFFEDAGVLNAQGFPEYNVVIRSSVTGATLENRVPRRLWNGDHLDGSLGVIITTGAFVVGINYTITTLGNTNWNTVAGTVGVTYVVGSTFTAANSGNGTTGQATSNMNPSGITADPTAIQMVSFEYEWYGAGQVIIGFCINGMTHIIHTFNTGNILTVPWCSTPFLPIRLELENLTGVSGDHYLYQGSNSLISEGVATKLGISVSMGSPIAGTNLATKELWYPILSIRLNPSFLKGIVLPTSFQVSTFDNTFIFYRIVRNCTFGTGGNGWTDHPDPNSFTQYQTFTAPSNILDADQGSVVDRGFVAGGSGGTSIALDKDTGYQLGRSSMGTVSDTFTLLAASHVTNKDAVAAITWIEQR